MPDFPVKNQYRGINAHLHSFWQATGTWNRFHNTYMGRVLEKLRQQLIPMGYIAEIEESVQIRRLDDDLTRRPRADVIVYDADPYRPSASGTAPVAELTVADLVEEDIEHPYSAISLRPILPGHKIAEAVAWIELLSPTNKGNSLDAGEYVGKRRGLLDAGIVFVELDFLHETPPTFEKMADYTQGAAGSSPYRILMLDPRPNLKTGPAKIYPLHVDDPFPEVTIPLNAGDKVEFDFGIPYQRLYEDSLFGYGLDYNQFPMNFERYSPADQARIARRMLAILKAKQAGVDLETAPLPVEEHLTLDEARAQLEAAKSS